MLIDAIIDKYGHKEGLTLVGDTIKEWPYSESKPTKTQLKTILDEYKVKIEYKVNRVFEYPSIEEQLDMMYHDKVNGTSTWATTIATIKAKHPKPTE